jgi:ribosome-binding factor A
MSASEIRRALMDVARERLKAERVGLGTAVTELAMLRGLLDGRQVG